MPITLLNNYFVRSVLVIRMMNILEVVACMSIRKVMKFLLCILILESAKGNYSVYTD